MGQWRGGGKYIWEGHMAKLRGKDTSQRQGARTWARVRGKDSGQGARIRGNGTSQGQEVRYYFPVLSTIEQ